MKLLLVAAASTAAALISVTTADAGDPATGSGSSSQGSAPNLDRPPGWYKKPTPERVRAAWPIKALKAGISGKVRLDCQVNIHGLLEDCPVLSDTPAGQNFGTAALLLTPQFLFTPAIVSGQVAPSRVRMPIIFDYQGPPRADAVVGSATL